MFNRKGLFDVALDATQLAIFTDFIAHAQERLKLSRAHVSIADRDEPQNPAVESEDDRDIIHLSRQPTLSPRSNTAKNLLAHGFRFLGLTSFLTTVSAKPNVYFISGGVPRNETANCNFYQWTGCIESFIANETHTLARFMLASTNFLNDTVSDTANFVGKQIAATSDPLVKILRAMLLYYPQWPNTTNNCRHVAADAQLNTAVLGNSTAIGEQACYFFNAQTIKLSKNYIIDYVREEARVAALPEAVPHAEVALIVVGVSMIVSLGVAAGIAYMHTQTQAYKNQRNRLIDAFQRNNPVQAIVIEEVEEKKYSISNSEDVASEESEESEEKKNSGSDSDPEFKEDADDNVRVSSPRRLLSR